MSGRPVAIIAGGGRGIGRACAERAAAAGHDICLAYLSDEESARDTVESCADLGAKVLARACDVADEDEVAELFEACDAALGPPSLLVNSAGITGGATRFLDLQPTALHETFGVGLYGTVHATQQAALRMSTDRGGVGGAIVNISCVAAVTGGPGGHVHYAASKGAVETLTIGLARELGPEGIRVNAVRAAWAEGESPWHGTPGSATPLGRASVPEDVAAAVMWLASDEAAYVTGAILPVTGGV